ncbi:restriction endonuclease [Streptomyces phaeoluteigriseus]|uniref:Restriction endonuclease n=1 Tax=Streptomyces phaeoluteigriseus TaxID=114686 RepID=A0ABY4Z935_9ACTN|nr:restriction endonuclease [Streptomyces phaeoluteigriseus]USQ85567.1 restriction endonuclease [Streptomyces phaeoluteigriseus]
MTREDTQAARPPKPPARRQIQSWQEAEHNAAAWMRHWGYEDARAQPGGSDGGVDVRSRRALGQVKYQAVAVGRPELQRLFGARGRALDKELLFFTGSSYAATAIEYAAENGIALFVYGLDGSMTAVNAPARRIATALPHLWPNQHRRRRHRFSPLRRLPDLPRRCGREWAGSCWVSF